MKPKQLFESEVAMNLMRIIRVSAVVIGLGFVTLIPRVCHAQAEVNPDFYDNQPPAHVGTSVEHHGVAKLIQSSLVRSTHLDCNEGAIEKSGCSLAPVSARARRANLSLNAKGSHRSNAAPSDKVPSQADAQSTQKSAGG